MTKLYIETARGELKPLPKDKDYIHLDRGESIVERSSDALENQQIEFLGRALYKGMEKIK